jgi:hypothetical protein
VTQPDHVPLQASDRVRPSALLPPPDRWTLDRPAEQVELAAPVGPRLGTTGPDLGYGLKLARRLEGDLVLTPGEHSNDVVAGCFACGARRAAAFGRAPTIHDMRWAYALWGYLGGAPEALVAWRRPLFQGAAHHYWDQRRIVDAVRPEALRLTPTEAREHVSAWRDRLIV